MTKAVKEGLNFNTILITIVLMLSAWTLKKVSEMGEAQAGLTVRVNNHDSQITELRGSVRDNTSNIVDLRVNRSRNP